MSHLHVEMRQRAEELIGALPRPRSAMLPLLHLVQEQDGYLSEEGIAEVAELTGTTPADVRGTASFYEMFHLEPVGTYVVSVCTNVACLLAGGLELLEHASATLGCAVGETSDDGLFTLEEAECLADCDVAPCVAGESPLRAHPNRRRLRRDDQRAARRVAAITTSRATARSCACVAAGGLRVSREEIAEERAMAKAARDERAKESA